MFPIQINDIILGMSLCMFGLGVISIIIGIIILVTKMGGGDLKVIAQQTSQLAQKGITDDVAGLVGNASSLIDALNQLARTASGIGIFLILVGFFFTASAYYLVIQVHY